VLTAIDFFVQYAMLLPWRNQLVAIIAKKTIQMKQNFALCVQLKTNNVFVRADPELAVAA
jgi:hypothetical protein